MSEKKKAKKEVKKKKAGKYDIVVAVDASFEDIVKRGLSFNPKHAKAS